MLNIKELVIVNNQQGITLVDNLSFSLNKNDKIAIIGNEGSGKSTLLKVINSENLNYISYTGEIVKEGIIGFLEQNISYEYDEMKVYEYIELSGINYSFDYFNQVYKLSSNFNLDYKELQYRKIKTLSGGEKVKVGLIKTLMINPDILLLDEPSNDIDFETLLFLEDFLIETDIPVIFISHDQRLLENVSNAIIHLQYDTKFKKSKTFYLKENYKKYKELYFSKYESDLMIARKQRKDYDAKMEKFRQVYQKVEHQQNQAVRDPVLGRLLKKKISNLKSQHRRYEKEEKNFVEIPTKEDPMNLFFENNLEINNSKQMVYLENLDLQLKNGNIIKDISLSLKGSDKVVIIGNNGIGKTTLMEYIYEDVKKNNIKVGYLSQNYLDVLDSNQSAVDFLLSQNSNYEEAKIKQILGSLGLNRNEMDYKIESLSEGTKLKVLLLYLVSQDFELLLLDEPTRNISPINQDELYNLFLNFNGAIIAVTHDRTFIEEVFDDIYELKSDGLIKK